VENKVEVVMVKQRHHPIAGRTHKTYEPISQLHLLCSSAFSVMTTHPSTEQGHLFMVHQAFYQSCH
jgi:hypothetical protein